MTEIVKLHNPTTFSFRKLTNSPSVPLGIQMFISEDFAVTISHDTESLLRNTWQPSVLSIDTVGHFPLTWNKRVKIRSKKIANKEVELQKQKFEKNSKDRVKMSSSSDIQVSWSQGVKFVVIVK